MDSSGAKVCAWVGLALAALFTLYELRWLIDSPSMALPLMGLSIGVILVALSVILLPTQHT